MACQAEAQQGTHTPAAVQWAKAGGPEGTRTLSLPADNGLLWLVELRIQKWPAKPKPWRRLVGGAGNAPVVTSDVCFATPDLQAGSRNTSQIGSGGGSCAHGGRVYEARLNLILPAFCDE